MTQLAHHPAYLLIADRLDAIGQKYRVQRLVRGVMLWIVFALAATVVAAFAAHLIGQSRWIFAITTAWLIWIVGSSILWFFRPMLLRPRPVQVARLVEARIPDLHNGLTNSILLASAKDLSQSPWLPQIFEEVLLTTRGKPLDDAIRWSDLRPLSLRLLPIFFLSLLAVVLMPSKLAHGWQQMFSPATFVPRVGVMEITGVQPGDATVVAGQPLEIAIIAKGPQTPDAKLIFDSKFPEADLVPTVQGDDNALKYSYRIEHVDEPVKYRVEVGGTQSPWYSVSVVRDVKFQTLEIQVAPPPYTKQPKQAMVLKPQEIAAAQVSVPQGSRVTIAASVDVPADKAILQLGDAEPADMQASQGNRRFFREVPIVSESNVSVGLMEGNQVVARVPEGGLTIHCKPDDPPAISMKWPSGDTAVAPAQNLDIAAHASDDYGVASARLLRAIGDGPMEQVAEQTFADSPTQRDLKFPLKLTADQSKHDATVRVQIEVTDNRNLTSLLKDGGPQTTHGPELTIRFRDPERIAAEEKDRIDMLRARLLEMLKKQQDLQTQTLGYKPGDSSGAALAAKIGEGQQSLRSELADTAQKFEFDDATRYVQKALLMLAVEPAKQAIDLSSALATERDAKQQTKLSSSLQAQQQHVITTLESLLAMLTRSREPTTQPAGAKGDDLLSKSDAYKKLDEALKAFMKEEQRILDQSANLAKTPVANFNDDDKKKLAELLMAQEKMDAFMQARLSDFSKNAEQDLSNPSLLKDLMEMYSEVTMAKDALKQQAVEIAVPAEENGLELAKELSSNIDKWLSDKPDRQQWTQEDPLTKSDAPLPELPKELEDMIGKLMEQEEDLFNQMEDANANWHDSMDKGVGWDAMDGPISDNSAKGVTGNQLPNDNEMQGRSGEGRSGKSQGEFVGDSAQGKGGRRTPTRLDPTPFEKGQINDTSKDPTGGATGGGKISGQGGEGLEGPVPPEVKQQMQRLAQQQAQIRNAAERLNLQYQLGRYDNFKLLQSIALMRRVESDLEANRYRNALRRRDVLIDSMESSKLLSGAEIHVEQDTTPTASRKTQQEIGDAMKGNLPPAWEDALREYYKSLSRE